MRKSKRIISTPSINSTTKKPSTPIAFSVSQELKDQIEMIATARKQSKSTVLRECIKESLNSDLPAEAYHYVELSEVLYNKNIPDKQKIVETKRILKELIKLRGTCHE